MTYPNEIIGITACPATPENSHDMRRTAKKDTRVQPILILPAMPSIKTMTVIAGRTNLITLKSAGM